VADAMLVLRRGGIDWSRLVEQAETRGFVFRLGLGLEYLWETRAAPIPDDLLDALRAHRPRARERVEYWARSHEHRVLGFLPFWVCNYLRSETTPRWLNPWRFIRYLEAVWGVPSAHAALGGILVRAARRVRGGLEPAGRAGTVPARAEWGRSVDWLRDVLRPPYRRIGRGAWQGYLRARWVAMRVLRAGGRLPAGAEPLRGFHASIGDWSAAPARRGLPPGAFCRELDPGGPASRPAPSILGDDGRRLRPLVTGPSTVPAPPLFVAAIPGGRVYGDAGAAIAPDGRLLVDTAGIHPLLPFREREGHAIWRVSAFSPPAALHGQVAVLAAWHAGWNYFHWMFNVLPRLELLRLAGIGLSAVDLFVVNRPRLPFQHETLARLGLIGTRLLFADEGLHARADTLLVTSSLRFSGHYTPCVLAFLRREFLAEGGTAPAARTRLYVSREDARHRRLVNEAECLDVLRPLGFEKVTLSGMAVRDQAMLFSGAAVIVAPHGAGLANLVFCGPRTTVVELCSPSELRSHYLQLSHARGLEHHWVVGEHAGGRQDFRVRPRVLARALRSIGIG
jgi:hypothetical protein